MIVLLMYAFDMSLIPELDTCKFKISGLLISSVELLWCQIIQR